MKESSEHNAITIVYDGQCPFCSNYVQLLELKKRAGKVELFNARELPETIQTEIAKLGLNLDEGMAVKYQDQWHYAADAMHVLGLLSNPKGMFNRLNYLMMKNQRFARLVYPVLRFFRNMTLKAMGRKKINDSI